MATATTQLDLVGLIASEIACGIDNAVGYWLGRIEQQLADSGLTADEQLRAIELVLEEYKQLTDESHFPCAQA